MIKAIIFDCFGVVISDGFDETYKQFGGNPERDKEFLEGFVFKVAKGEIDSWAQVISEKLGISEEQWRKADLDNRKVNYALLEYIDELKTSYKVAMLTNIGKSGVEKAFDPGLLQKYFDPIVESAQIGFAKPEAGAYQITAEKLGERISDCIFIDDRQKYVDGAIAVGMKAILYKNLEQMKEDLGEY